MVKVHARAQGEKFLPVIVVVLTFSIDVPGTSVAFVFSVEVKAINILGYKHNILTVFS